MGARILDELRIKVTPPNELNDPFELTPYSRNNMTLKYLLSKAENEPEHFRPILKYRWEHEGITGELSEVIAAVKQLSPKTYGSFLKQYGQGLMEKDFSSIHEASEHLVVLCLSER